MKGELHRLLSWAIASRLRLATLLYLISLGAFLLWLVIVRDDLVAILGTLIFTVAATMLATLKFSEDLRASTAVQIATLRELSRAELDAAQARNRESMESIREGVREQVSVLSDRFERVLSSLASIAQLLAESVKEAEQVRKKQEDLFQQQEKARGEAETRRQAVIREREEEAQRRVPRVCARIVERPVAILGFIKDFWLEARSENSVKALRIIGRSFSRLRGAYGSWQRWTGQDLVLPGSYFAIKFGSIGVRGVHDTVEVHVEAVNPQDERFVAAFEMPLARSDWIVTDLQRVA